MNKKLFSWKALAGLALLVAMGLTSCKQGTEVDPNDPYNTQKPVQPGTSTKGDADLTFTITKAVQLKELWDSYDAAKKTELMKKTAITIDVNFKDFEIVAGETLVLQKYFNTVANSALTVRFNGNFKNADKQDVYLDLATNLTGARVNVVVPAQAFNLHLNCAGVRTFLSSAGATIGTLFTNADGNKNNALSINSGVTVKGIDDTATGAILLDGGIIEALIANGHKTIANGSIVTKKGFKIGNQDVFTSNVIINKAGLTVTNDKDTPLGDIVINKNCDVTLGFVGTKVNSITGTKASESKVTFVNTVDATTGAITYNNDALKNVGSFKNVTITNNGGDFNVESATFDGALIADDATLKGTSVSNVEFGKNVYVYYSDNNVTYTLTKVAFPANVTPTWYSFNVNGGVEKTTTPTKTTYQWNINTKTWDVVGAAGIYAANAGDAGIEVSSNDVEVSGGAITKGADKIGDHKVFTIVSGNKVYLLPENCALLLNDCTYGGAAIADNNINSAINWVGGVDPTWLSVKVGSDAYTWKKQTTGGWILVK